MMINYSIPKSPEEMIELSKRPVDEELVAMAIAGVVQMARSNGESLADLNSQVLADDPLLDYTQRRWLSDLITHAWDHLPFNP